MANSMNNLTTLIKRLEAATSRLEDMVPTMTDSSTSANGQPALPEAGLSTGRGSDRPSGTVTSPKPVLEPLPPAIDDFDALINGDVKTYVNMSEEIGGLVAEQSAAVLRSFAAQRKFLIVTTKAKKPDIQSPGYMEILKELQSMMGAVSDIREANRTSPLSSHLTTVSEGIAVLGWITIDPKPAAYIGDIIGSAQYYGNRVIKEYKEKDRTHVEWVQAFYRIFNSLTIYVKQHYPSGVTWNNRNGIDPLEALYEVQSGQPSSKAPVTPSNSGGPPPPPPPPLPTFDNAPANGVSASSRSSTTDMGAVFDQLSKGEAVTSHLRKVDPSSQTHKNPSLRAGTAVPSAPTRTASQTSASSHGKSPLPGKKPKPESMRTKKPPKKGLDGNKWIIEHYDSHDGMLEIEASITHSILISRCTKTAIRVIGKANAISIDNCAGLSLVIDSLVSSVDVIKSPKFEVQVLGTLPTIMLDQVDGAAIYLGRESLRTEVFTSKCAGVNINLPGMGEEDDYVERPVPEQIKTVVRGGTVVSEMVEHAG